MAEVMDLTSELIEDFFHVESRGWTIFVMRAPFEMNRGVPEIVGKVVRIQFEDMPIEGIVRGVDRFLLNSNIPIRFGESIGLAFDRVDFHQEQTIQA